MLFFAGKIHSFAEILIEYSWGKIYRAIKQISKRIFLTLHFVKKQKQNALFKSMATFFVDLCKAPFSYDERRWFANRRRRPRGAKQQRQRGPRRRIAN